MATSMTEQDGAGGFNESCTLAERRRQAKFGPPVKPR
jgi:hypothetical protein